MTLEDFSNNFDVLLNSYTRKVTFGEDSSAYDIRLDEYEKSLYLTNAQEELILFLYNGKNIYKESFEETEEIRRYLADLINEQELSPLEDSVVTQKSIIGIDGLKHQYFDLPDGSTSGVPSVWFITYESAQTVAGEGACGASKSIQVVPVKQDDYHKIKKNPFRGPNNRRALRLDLSGNKVEIVSKFTLSKYYIRYLTKPTPIILIDLPDGVTIENLNKATPCKVHESLHQMILELAVNKVLQTKGISTGNKEKNNK